MQTRFLLPLIFAILFTSIQVHAELQPRDRIIVQTLIKLKRYDVSGNEKWKGAVQRYAKSVRGTEEHLDIVSKFQVSEEYPVLLQSILDKPQGAQATNATKLLFTLEADPLIADALQKAKPEQAGKLLSLLGFVQHPSCGKLLEQFIQKTQDADLKQDAAQALTKVGNAEQKEFAQKYLNTTHPTTTASTTIDIAKLAKRKGDPAKGKIAYQKLCVACHVAENIGIDYGPALTEIGDKLPKTELYTSIIDPSAGVSFNYEGWIFQLKDGTSAAGIIHSETDNNVTLRMPGGLRQTYPKSKIQSREKMKTSLMPPGLHLALQEQELIDLIEYLASLKKK